VDIVVTIPKNEYENDRIETEEFLSSREARQFWAMGRRPAKLDVGDRAYFVKNGLVESSMRVVGINTDATQKCDVTDRVWKGACILYLDDLQYCGLGIAIKGFRGFRYRWWQE
jgi:hypothetical protein